MCKLDSHYKNHVKEKDGTTQPRRTFLISQMTDADPIYQSLKTLSQEDIYEENSYDVLVSIINEIKQKNKETDKFKE